MLCFRDCRAKFSANLDSNDSISITCMGILRRIWILRSSFSCDSTVGPYARHDSNYCAENASSTLPGIPSVKVYPDPTKTMPSTTVGPGAAIDPPFALTPFTV
jgi:hypothetical protein